MWDKWGKCMKKKMRHTVVYERYSAWLRSVVFISYGEAAGGYGVRFNRFAFSMALSMALR